MFKIRTPNINDLNKLEKFALTIPNVTTLNFILKNKTFCLLQSLVPQNFRFLPSIHVATEEENVLGFIDLRCTSKTNNCWQIDELYVTDEFRNKGIGEELLRYVLSVYGGHGVEHFLAEIDSQNFPALSLFHNCGFRRYSKVFLYEKEINNTDGLCLLDKDFILRTVNNNDLNEIEKIELSSIPPDFRPAIGRSKEYFKNKNMVCLIDRNRNLLIGWAQIERKSDDYTQIELILSPGWNHLYEYFFNSLLSTLEYKGKSFRIAVRVHDYLAELTEILTKSGFLSQEVKELLIRTIWQKVKERKPKAAKVGLPRTAPT